MKQKNSRLIKESTKEGKTRVKVTRRSGAERAVARIEPGGLPTRGSEQHEQGLARVKRRGLGGEGGSGRTFRSLRVLTASSPQALAATTVQDSPAPPLKSLRPGRVRLVRDRPPPR